jgi:hypothetical protein
MNHRTTTTIALAGAALMTAGIASACSSGSSTSSATIATPVTGTETFAGTEVMTPAQAASSNFQPTIPIRASGLFADTGHITLNGGNKAGPTTIVLGRGGVTVHHAATNPNQNPVLLAPASACVYGLTEAVKYTVTSGTGSYANITGGHGIATVTFKIDLPKGANGKCNASQTAMPTGGDVSFSAVGPITRTS